MTEIQILYLIGCYISLGAGILLGRFWDVEEISVYPEGWRGEP